MSIFMDPSKLYLIAALRIINMQPDDTHVE